MQLHKGAAFLHFKKNIILLMFEDTKIKGERIE